MQDLQHGIDPVRFARDCLGISLDPWQVQVLQSSNKRQLLNCSRQSGKSTTAAIMAIHMAIYRPPALVLLVSPSLRQSGELFRTVMGYFGQLPHKPASIEENRLSLRLANGSRIVSLPGTEQTIRGFSGASLIVEDEAARVPDDLYYAVRPMLAVSGGRLILMSTPFGKRGHFFEAWAHMREWEKVMIPATQCSRISPAFLDEERAALGEWFFRQEYLCEFVETGDSVFPYAFIHAAVSDDVKPLFPVRSAGRQG